MSSWIQAQEDGRSFRNTYDELQDNSKAHKILHNLYEEQANLVCGVRL
ncbi:hypothetical protein MM817_02944 [Acidibacillus sp. S0AB]|uniref:Uncharacterized protein n=1 Tax=Sulfoacidibacillus ferrooxidans TaxID=2005001 RepID=A0A9X2AFN5_9BACL|nr:hypothetical protein [Sulfoacidibacillus ferrooxidans]